MQNLKTKLACMLDKDGYFKGTCLVNANPLSKKEEWQLPKDAVLIDPPRITSSNLKYRYSKEANSWIQEVNQVNSVLLNNNYFESSLQHLEIIRLLLDADLKRYKIPDIANNLVAISRKDLKKLKKLIARNILTQKGYKDGI